MAVSTAQMLIGHGPQERGGIDPTHYAYLSENGRPAWILVPENIHQADDSGVRRKIVWIPTDEHILEDGLLMVAVHALKDDMVRAVAERTFRNPRLEELQLLKQTNLDVRRELYQMCRNLPMPLKIVLTVLDGSTLLSHLPKLADYPWNVDVCLPGYSKYYSHRTGGFVIRGSLDNL